MAGDYPPNGAAAARLLSSSFAQCRLSPAARHAGKRRQPRASKCAHTTYIITDATIFHVMVQRVTGADEVDLQQHETTAGHGLELLLPQLGVEQFLPMGSLRRTWRRHMRGRAHRWDCDRGGAALLFPTLDSWNVMYGKKNKVIRVSPDEAMKTLGSLSIRSRR